MDVRPLVFVFVVISSCFQYQVAIYVCAHNNNKFHVSKTKLPECFIIGPFLFAALVGCRRTVSSWLSWLAQCSIKLNSYESRKNSFGNTVSDFIFVPFIHLMVRNTISLGDIQIERSPARKKNQFCDWHAIIITLNRKKHTPSMTFYHVYFG